MSDQTSNAQGDKDRTAEFVRLLSKNERRLKGYILSLVPNWTDAEDIFADTNARIWEQFDKYSPSKDGADDEFGSWACTVAHYLVMAYRARQQREKQRYSDVFVEVVAETVAETDGERDDRFRCLAECLALLRSKSRDLLQAFYAEKESVEEIAARSGGTRDSVYKSVSRSREQLHRCIEDRLLKDGHE